MNPAPTAVPPLPPDVEVLMPQLKMPYARALAPELLITARTQRWEPAEIVKALLVEEVAGRSRSMLTILRKAAGFPTGKTFDTWDPAASSIPLPTQRALRTLEWIHRKENVGRRARGKRSSLRPSASRSSKPGCAWRGFASKTSVR